MHTTPKLYLFLTLLFVYHTYLFLQVQEFLVNLDSLILFSHLCYYELVLLVRSEVSVSYLRRFLDCLNLYKD
jgi:hypothetical protein